MFCFDEFPIIWVVVLFICVHICTHTCVCVCLSVWGSHVCVYVSSSFVSYLIFWGRVSPWGWNSMVQLCCWASKSLRILLCLPPWCHGYSKHPMPVFYVSAVGLSCGPRTRTATSTSAPKSSSLTSVLWSSLWVDTQLRGTREITDPLFLSLFLLAEEWKEKKTRFSPGW